MVDVSYLLHIVSIFILFSGITMSVVPLNVYI